MAAEFGSVGTVRLICDLVGLSGAGVYRYTATVDHPSITNVPVTTDK